MNPAYYKKWKEAGLCTNCGNAPQHRGILLCVTCDEKNKKHQALYRSKTTEARKKRNRAWYVRTHGLRIVWRKEYARRIKKEVMEHYGGACTCCGETELVFLALDHINGGGARDRRENGLGGYTLYQRLRRTGYPATFQILCQNCNWAKYALGKCPHERLLFSRASNS